MAIEILPVKWGRGRKQEFIDWYSQELSNTIGDRQPLERTWQDNIVQWRARIHGDGVADVPFVGASDVEVPVTAMHYDPVMADFMQTLHVPQDFWSFVGKRADTVDVAKPLQEFMSQVERGYLHMRRVNAKVLQDTTIHGTGIYKCYIHRDQRYVRSRTGAETPMFMQRPRIQHVPLQDFFIPAYAYDIDPDAPNGAAPWVAQRFYLTPAQLQERAVADSPYLPGYDKQAVSDVMRMEEDVEDNVQRTIDQQNRFVPFHRRRIELFEVHVRYATEEGGLERDLVVVWHQRSRRILRAIGLPFLHGRRPFEVAQYLPGLGFYGMGLAEIDEWAQLTISRVLNNLVDNTLVSNSIMLGIPAGMNFSPDEPMHMMKTFALGPNERIDAIQLGRPNPQASALLGMLMQWGEQRVSVSELRQGDISNLPSRTPASSVLSILSEGKKRFDMILSNLREGPLHGLGLQTLQNLIQITDSGDPRWMAFAREVLNERDAAAVQDILRGPVHDVDAKFGLYVTATSSQVNREIDKQNRSQLAGMVMQLDQLLLQYAQMLAQGTGDPTVLVSTLQAAYSGASELKKRMLEDYDVKNMDRYMPAEETGLAPAPAAPAAPAAPGVGAVDPMTLATMLRGVV